MKKILLISIITSLFLSAFAQKKLDETSKNQIPDIIPFPQLVEMKAGKFEIDKKTIIVASGQDEKQIAKLLSQRIEKLSGLTLQITSKKNKSNFISLVLSQNEKLGAEGYLIKSSANSVEIEAKTTHGLFYALQTIYQVLPVEVFSINQKQKQTVFIPAMQITDNPRFSYRGMHLDVSRHFFSVEFIKKYIDILAMHKMNTFHWHLVDDQGWRIEIKKYPKLTEIGSKRINREDKPWGKRNYEITGDTTYYEGFYTQDQVKEVVRYAQERFITVVPEIEMPAHVMCAIAAYPELSCSQKQIEVPSGSVWPITEIYCAGNDFVFTFNQDVLSEIMELFPSKYIHIGGDEATKTNWEKCSKCQQRMKDENLADVHELQSYFIKRIEQFIVSKGRQLIGWDEILEGGLAPEATVMSWRGINGGIQAAKAGHDVVMTPVSHCYFDYYQNNPDGEPLAIGGYTPLKKVYDYEPIPDELTKQQAVHILGAQANLWTEYMPDGKHVEYMALPRMAALAEVVWSNKEIKNWDNFKMRMLTQFKRYEAADYNYCKTTIDALEKNK